MKGFIFLSLLLAVLGSSYAQDVTTVESKGVGIRREDAVQDALRAAVGQAAGVAVQSETKVENFMVISDAISSRTEGYITTYQVLKETPFPDRFEVLVKATVSLSPLKADLNLLAKSVGGIRFLVMYNPLTIEAAELGRYDFAVERVNEALSQRKYRYIEKSRFESLKKEAEYLYQNQPNPEPESYVQHLGFKSDAQFIILISKISVSSKSEAFDTRNSSKVMVEMKAYDNCTAEGLGTIVLESGWSSGRDIQSTIHEGIKQAISEKFPDLLRVFQSYIGEWVNNGTPYELRFYASGGFRDFRDLRNKIKADSNFGGQLEIVAFDHYSKLNCTFRKKPDELADAVLDYADQVPFFKDKEMDVRLIYGRQISFAPRGVRVPELDQAGQSGKPLETTNPVNPPVTKEVPKTTPATKTPVKKKPVSTKTTKPK